MKDIYEVDEKNSARFDCTAFSHCAYNLFLKWDAAPKDCKASIYAVSWTNDPPFTKDPLRHNHAAIQINCSGKIYLYEPQSNCIIECMGRNLATCAESLIRKCPLLNYVPPYDEENDRFNGNKSRDFKAKIIGTPEMLYSGRGGDPHPSTRPEYFKNKLHDLYRKLGIRECYQTGEIIPELPPFPGKDSRPIR